MPSGPLLLLGLLFVCSSTGVFSIIRAATRGSVNSKLTPRKRSPSGNLRPRLPGNELTSILPRRKTAPLKRKVVFSLTGPQRLEKSPPRDKRPAGDNAGRVCALCSYLHFSPIYLALIKFRRWSFDEGCGTWVCLTGLSSVAATRWIVK